MPGAKKATLMINQFFLCRQPYEDFFNFAHALAFFMADF